MNKKVLTDSLIHVAIILSLMRPDLNDYLYDYELEEPEVQDYIMGESLAYLQTSFHQNRPHIINSPKSIVERDMYIRDLIRDLTRPSRIVPNVHRDVDTWLVSEVTPRVQTAPAPAHVHTQQEAESGGGSSQTTQSNVELSKEEMNLIDFLWQQDVDAGRDVEVSSSGPESSHDEPESETDSPGDLNNNDENQENNQNLANRSGNPNNNDNRDPCGSSGCTGSVLDDEKVAERGAESSSLIINSETGEIEHPILSHELPEMHDDISNGAVSLEEAVRALEHHIAADWTADAEMYPPHAADYVPYNAVTSSVMTYNHGPMTYAQTPANFAAHMSGVSTMFPPTDHGCCWSNSSDYLHDMTTANCTLMPPSLTATNSSIAPTYAQNNTMNTAANMSSLISEFDTASLFPNITSVSGLPSVYNLTHGNQSMIDLLDSEDLDMMDLDHLNFTSDASSIRASTSSPVSVSDSAVSMSSGSSPLTVSASPPYDGAAGASGGQDDYYPPNKYKYAAVKAEYDYYDSDETRLDQAGYDQVYFNATNQTGHYVDPAYTIAHNHTYMMSETAPVEVRSQKASAKIHPPRDAMKAKQMNLPLSYDEIIEIPVEELTGVLQKYKLTEDQVQLIRDIRRRGKNKLAAQNCRKRRIQEIEDLENEVEIHRKEKMRLADERSRLEKELTMVRSGYDRLYDNVLRSLTDENGQRYDSSTISLEMNSEGRFVLVPRNSSSSSDDSLDFDTKYKRKK